MLLLIKPKLFKGCILNQLNLSREATPIVFSQTLLPNRIIVQVKAIEIRVKRRRKIGKRIRIRTTNQTKVKFLLR
jgi:hypothetical protein